MSRGFVIGIMIAGLTGFVVYLAMGRRDQGRENEGRTAEAASLPRTVPDPLIQPRIVILKSERRLELYSGDRRVKNYRIGLGFKPMGHKMKEGDGRTPEGRYYICNKNPRSRFYLSLGLSYPNDGDARRGLESGLITRAQHDQIVQAIRSGDKPPWNTPLGGEIFIHGNGSRSDWTFGCVALDDEHVRELYDIIPVGTPVEIRP